MRCGYTLPPLVVPLPCILTVQICVHSFPSDGSFKWELGLYPLGLPMLKRSAHINSVKSQQI